MPLLFSILKNRMTGERQKEKKGDMMTGEMQKTNTKREDKLS
jgi:hypothetical protein